MRWHLAKSESQKASWLVASLANLGIEVFYPKVTWRRRGKPKSEPLFPNYVFCRFDPVSVDWKAIQWAPGLGYFLGVSGQPTPIPDTLVEYIQNRLDGAAKHAAADGPSIQGMEEAFEQASAPKRRCSILLKAINQTCAMNDSSAKITPIFPLL